MYAGPEEDKDFPVEILPHLYLGNAANSEDKEALARHRIQYILNVTPDLPNVFESAGSIKYMQIPISDHWSQNLASFFPQAIQFIGELSLLNLTNFFVLFYIRRLEQLKLLADQRPVRSRFFF